MISEQDGLSGVSGVLGLSRPSDAGKMEEDWRGVGPVLLNHMAEAGIVPSSNFAIYLDSKKEEKRSGVASFIDIGETIEEHMKPGVDVVWFELEPHFYWMTSHMQGVKIGETTYAWDSKGTEY